jgi:hypothetical protein
MGVNGNGSDLVYVTILVFVLELRKSRRIESRELVSDPTFYHRICSIQIHVAALSVVYEVTQVAYFMVMTVLFLNCIDLEDGGSKLH